MTLRRSWIRRENREVKGRNERAAGSETGRRLLHRRQSQKASRSGGTARIETGQRAEPGSRKVWKKGKGLNGKGEQDLKMGGDRMLNPNPTRSRRQN